MAYTNNFGQQAITYPQLIMQQIQTIQKIYSKELKDGDKVYKSNIGEQLIEGEDTRYSFLQAVEMFGSLLFPYFLETTPPQFNAYCELLDKELVEIIIDDTFLKKVKLVFDLDKEKITEKIKDDEGFRTQLNVFFLNYKVVAARKMFRELIQLFKDNSFLENQGYTDNAAGGGLDYNEAEDGTNFDMPGDD